MDTVFGVESISYLLKCDIFSKICMTIHLCIKKFLATYYLIRYKFATHLNKPSWNSAMKKPNSQTLSTYGSETNLITWHLLNVCVTSCRCFRQLLVKIKLNDLTLPHYLSAKIFRHSRTVFLIQAVTISLKKRPPFENDMFILALHFHKSAKFRKNK